MKRKFNSIKALLVSGLMLMGYAADAQFTGSYKFPQNTTYSYGRKPSNTSGVTSQDALDSYNYWKTNFVTSSGACGYRRVIWDYYSGGRGATDRSSTVSEGIAYGMLLSAYAGDQSLFDDLWKYYKANRNGNGVMNWQIQNCSIANGGANGATDAELDVAMALVVASYQWQSDAYLTDAKNMIKVIREKEFEGVIQKPGDMFGGSNLVNPSYFSPGYYRVFATLDAGQSAFWTSAAAKGYEIIFKADKNSKGLVPDWCDANGNFSSSAGSYQDQGKSFIYDAVRTPFRSAVDFLWFGTADGAKYCSRLIDWAYDAHGGGTESLGSKYDIAGNKLDASHSNTFVGCFAIGAMAADPANGGKKSESNYQSFLDRAYKDNENTTPGYGQYFNATFKVLSQFVLTGNFYLPPPDKCTAPSLGAAKSLCKGSPVALNSGISGATSYSWKKNGIAISGATASTYNATEAATYEVVVNQNGCVRRSSVEVASATLTADFSYSIQASKAIFTNTSTGASDYTWSFKQGAGASTSFATTRDAENSFLSAGSYDVTLVVKNTTFGCAGSATVTKKIVVGGGVGWVADDFNDHTYSEPWVANTTNYAALPKTYCSKEDAAGGKAPECSNLPCSLFEVICKAGAGAQYNPFGINLREKDAAAVLDISAVPYASIKIRSTAAVNIGIGFNDGVLTTNRKFYSIAANKDTIISIDFSLLADQKGYKDAANPSYPVDFKKIKAIQFFPYEKVATFTGTIDIDWIIIGGKSLPAPQFNLKKDASGFLVYEDPDKDNVYTTVPDWSKVVRACSPKATVTANACSASEIRWFNGNSQIGKGSTMQLDPGKYTVQLINQGGVTTDTVEVVSGNVVADFLVERKNYGAHFINNSQGYHTWTWNYGDAANDLLGSTKWDIGYHDYKKAGAGTYNTSLTVTDTICKVSKTFNLPLVVACDQLVKTPMVVEGDSSGCEGKVVTFKILADANAEFTGWFPPIGTTAAKVNTADSAVTRVLTFGPSAGPFTIESANICGKATKKVNLAITATPSSDFTSVQTGLTSKFTAAYSSVPDATYSWTFGDGSGTSAVKNPTYTYTASGTFNACLTVNNACGTAAKVCKDVVVIPTGLKNLEVTGALKLYPTLASESISVELSGVSTVEISNIIGAVLSTHSMNDKATFDVSNLPNGVYFVNIHKGGESFKKKFIKQ